MTDQQHSRQRHHSRQRKDPGGTDQRAELPSFPHDSLCSNVSRTGRIIAIFRCFWLILIQNRVAIAIASLLWLLYRTGTQPRRIIYPCQQVAAVNVTVAFKGLIPALFLVRKRRCPHAANRDSLTKRQLLIAVFLFVAAFLGLEAYHFAIHAMPVALPAAPPRPGNPMPTTIAIVQAEQTPISNAEVEAMVQRAVAQAGGLEEIIEPGDSVVLKVNLVEDGWSPGDGVTTDPRVTRAVVRLAQAAGAETVAIVEGSARGRDGYFGRDVTRYAFHDSGYDSDWDMIDDETGVQLFDLNDAGGIDQHDPDKVTLVTIPNGLVRTQYYVPNVLLNCDVLVSIPTFKNHSATGITLSLKNRVGCAPSDIYHAPFAPYDNQMKWGVVHSVDSGFPRNVSGEYPVPPPTSDEKLLAHYATVDLNLVRPQDFVVVDGLVGITRGPVGHDQASPPMGLVLAGEDSVAVDTVATLVMNYDPAYVEHIAWANQRELGTMETSVITVLGDHVATVRRDFPLDHGGAGITVRADASPPWIGKISLTDGEAVCGDATIEGSEFGDDRGVVKAELLVDGEFVAAISNPSDPFTFVWDSTSVPAGEHEVAVTVYDAAFNEGSINCIVTTVGPCWSPDFHYSVIDSNNSGRVAIGEINGDGFNDVVVHRWGSNYGTGGDGSLTWYDGYENYDRSYDWQQTVIDSNGNFYGDDVIIADVNGDAYNDIVCCKEDHGTRLWWYEHPGVGHNPAVDPWAQHEFGQAGYSEEIKDIEVVDIDSDGKLDAIVRQKAGVTIWFQDDLDDVGNEWTVKTIDIKPQGREGMAVGDVDMDAHPDIVLNGYWVRNPHATGNARTDAWSEYSIHSIWYDQDTGQWWDNAVKTLVVDVNGDGANDVVFSHSEAFIETFPIAWYELNDYTLGDSGWTQHIILPSIRNCHTLQAGDMDNDGHNDIVAGQLRGEGQYPLYVLYNGGGVVPTWEQQTIDADIGCYNGEVGDIGNDGDLDFVSSKTWEVGPVYIYENQLDSGPSVLPPIIAPPADDVANPGIPYSRTPASTQGTPPISWSLVVGPPGMTIDPGTGEVSWPDPQPAGSAHPVTIGASNSAGSDEASWTLGVAEFEPVPPVENVVVNPSFQDGKSPWKFYTNGTGSFEVTSSAYDGTAAAHVTTVTGGTNIQLFQHDVPLEPNTEYQLSFVAYSNTGHDFSVSMVKHDPPYTNYGLTRHKVNLTTSWNTYSINFTTKNFSSPVNDARLVFWFASDAATGDQYWIDNVALFQVGVTFQYDLTASVVGGNGTISPTSGTYNEGTA
ncbi:MAG: DUF362 domain-containing protein, partial [Desulfobacterales bacterium]|nr:DUF362 domain-containing protein [Desulfobacterales bacterium]